LGCSAPSNEGSQPHVERLRRFSWPSGSNELSATCNSVLLLSNPLYVRAYYAGPPCVSGVQCQDIVPRGGRSGQRYFHYREILGTESKL
jgi:hypothetical protein